MLARARERVHEQHQPTGDRRRPGDVEVAMVESGLALAQEDRAQHEHERADRDVHEEDPRPAERTRQSAAEEHAGRRAATGDSTPDAEREVALASFLERRRQDRERGRREQRRPEPLCGAERDQRALGPREPVEERADREQRQAGHEQAPAAEQVGHAPTEEQDAAEEDRVGGDHPLEALLAEVEVGLDRRQRDVDDRDVEDDHELGRHEDGEAKPSATILRINGVASHLLSPQIVCRFHDIHSKRSCATLIPQ